jgi:hypothetical protein
MSNHTPSTDPFDTLLTLEDTLYTSAYTLGARDGAHAGRIEGRIFGLEKGFEKFAALGTLHGRAAVWSGQISRPAQTSASTNTPTSRDFGMNSGAASERPKGIGGEEGVKAESERREEGRIPRLDVGERTRNHVEMLHALSDPATFSTLNTEDAVADYDDRFKRAAAKAKIIERIVSTAPSSSAKRGGNEAGAKGKRDDNMEDFSGGRLLR